MLRSEITVLGPLTFKSKSAARKHVKSILNRHTAGEYLSGDDVKVVFATLQRHPSFSLKVGSGVSRIRVVRNGAKLSGVGFSIERSDGTVARFSYKTCFEGKLRPHSERVREAFRQAVRPSIHKWRENEFRKHNGHLVCAITGEIVDATACEVDHKDPNFSEILDCFLSLEGMPIEEVEIEISHTDQVEAVLSDQEFRRRWVKHHEANCELRILSVEGHRQHHGHI